MKNRLEKTIFKKKKPKYADSLIHNQLTDAYV